MGSSGAPWTEPAAGSSRAAAGGLKRRPPEAGGSNRPGRERPRLHRRHSQACPAIRRGQTLRFASSEELDACPFLQDRPYGPCSATCVPVNVAGRSIGVPHAVAPVDHLHTPNQVARLEALATPGRRRIGMLWVMERTILQAATDPLTGYPTAAPWRIGSTSCCSVPKPSRSPWGAWTTSNASTASTAMTPATVPFGCSPAPCEAASGSRILPVASAARNSSSCSPDWSPLKAPMRSAGYRQS
jgi:hypothetical protein